MAGNSQRGGGTSLGTRRAADKVQDDRDRAMLCQSIDSDRQLASGLTRGGGAPEKNFLFQRFSNHAFTVS
ncbi:hypothetical protein, partial [Massilia sp. TSP1-1-2]|uniref:hypothetical protein n=1 Tax=Massilia sp. TSP1-1-2 TaxID=2804649 RepID=UPI003CEEED4D